MGGGASPTRATSTSNIKCILSNYYPVVADDAIGEEDAKFETVMLSLRTARGVDLAANRYTYRIL